MDNPGFDLVRDFGASRESQARAIRTFVDALEPSGAPLAPEALAAPYPTDEDGYARAYDPISDPDGFTQAWRRHGFVVGRQVIDPRLCRRAVTRLKEIAATMSHGRCDLDDPSTYDQLPVDPDGVALMTRGFFELYHDDVLAQIRQSPRLYVHHALIWGTGELWTTFDRFGVKPPEHESSAALPLHVDQNPLQHPDFHTVQGILALEDCPLERGVTALAPGSASSFGAYAQIAGRGEYVELSDGHPDFASLTARMQPLPLRAGDIVTWDSRTTHANTANVSSQTRYVAVIAAGRARQNPDLLDARRDAMTSGLGSNVREALMHASKKPRFTDPQALAAVRAPEDLTLLGELLYGLRPYSSVGER